MGVIHRLYPIFEGFTQGLKEAIFLGLPWSSSRISISVGNLVLSVIGGRMYPSEAKNVSKPALGFGALFHISA